MLFPKHRAHREGRKILRTQRGTPAPPTNETKSTEEKKKMMNGLNFKFPDFSFERGSEGCRFRDSLGGSYFRPPAVFLKSTLQTTLESISFDTTLLLIGFTGLHSCQRGYIRREPFVYLKSILCWSPKKSCFAILPRQSEW